MAYPLTAQGALDAIEYGASRSVWGYNDSAVHAQDALTHWNSNEDHLAIQDILNAIYDIRRGMGYIHYGWNPFDTDCAIVWYLKNAISAPDPYELTAEKIVEAWIKNDFEGRALTIAVIDRMRQLIWNEPFNITWAARPEL